MKEFWLWVVIVSLIICLLFVTTLGLAYNHKQLKKVEVILQRAEQLDKKSKPKIEPEPEKE